MLFPVGRALGPARLPVHLLCEVLAYSYRLYAHRPRRAAGAPARRLAPLHHQQNHRGRLSGRPRWGRAHQKALERDGQQRRFDGISPPAGPSQRLARLLFQRAGEWHLRHGPCSALGINVGDGIQRHPTRLYEILFLAALALLLWLLERRGRLADGRRFQLFLSGYLLFRLLVKAYQAHGGTAGAGAHGVQWACVAGLGYYGWRWLREGTSRASSTLDVY
ncbi:prolipoprotein diacylglyceryl transferase family protein [Hymenobacter antarcticus]|uniref:prolipoprotein diacylglyceryl transferase family protein n=1 Tax=Hymenobacter antarcticus TaxID=486270 RepID=UPI0031EFC6CB